MLKQNKFIFGMYDYLLSFLLIVFLSLQGNIFIKEKNFLKLLQFSSKTTLRTYFSSQYFPKNHDLSCVMFSLTSLLVRRQYPSSYFTLYFTCINSHPTLLWDKNNTILYSDVPGYVYKNKSKLLQGSFLYKCFFDICFHFRFFSIVNSTFVINLYYRS